MKLKNSKEIQAFQEAIANCQGDVWLETPRGNKYDLKSLCCHYLAIDKLPENEDNEFELFCQYKEDELNFFRFFEEYPDAL